MDNYLYIPTTTRNLNNILISRSISPAYFYPKKGYGVQRFYLVSVNDNDKSTYCFSKKVEFSIAETDYEEDAILIIIPRNYINSCISDSVQLDNMVVHRVYDTIELGDLSECAIGFFSEDAKKRCEVNADKALEIKGFHYIKEIFKVTSSVQESLMVKDSSYKVTATNELVAEDRILKNERLRDKVKGANICFSLSLASKNKSVPWFSPDLSKQNKAIEKLLINKEIFRFEDGFDTVISEKLFSSVTKLSSSEITMLNIIVRVVLAKDIVFNNETFKTKRIEVLLEIGIEISNIIADWSSSSERRYINSLGQNLTEYKVFDINKTNSCILKSLAFVFIHGRDLDKIDSDLVNEPSEVHGVAFIIWGLLFGYCNIPKTIYDPIFGGPFIETKSELSFPMNKDTRPTPTPTPLHSDDGSKPPICNDCFKPMIEKVNFKSKVSFWGCVNYKKDGDNCRTTHPVIKYVMCEPTCSLDVHVLNNMVLRIKEEQDQGITVSNLKAEYKDKLGKMTLKSMVELIEKHDQLIEGYKIGNKHYLKYRSVD